MHLHKGGNGLMFFKRHVLGLALALSLCTGFTQAGEISPYLPADTEVYFYLNSRQILNSALVKQIGENTIRELMKSQQELTEVLKDLGLDPLVDIDRIVVAAPMLGEQDKGLSIIQGRFDLEKFHTRA